MNRTVIALTLGLVFVGAGCGVGRFEHVVQHSGGGIVQVDGAVVSGTSAAHLAMSEHCRGPWRALDRDEALAMYGAFAQGKGESGDGEPTAFTLDERHIAYECVSR